MLIRLPLYAAALPPCAERPHLLYEPWIDGRLLCMELVIRDPSVGTLGFTGLAVGDDGILYAARPLAGEIYAFDDSDGDQLPDTPRLYAHGMERPNSLIWHDGALYVSGESTIYRIEDGVVETLIADVPSGGGFWNAGLLIEPDGSIILATGAPCDHCDERREGRGAVLRYSGEGQFDVLATGLRSPGDLVAYRDAIWVNDSAPAGAQNLQDGLRRVEPGVDFGFPRCLADAAGCAVEDLRAIAFDPQSRPLGMAAYRGDAIPALEGALLVVLHGNRGAELVGYQLLALWTDDDGSLVRSYPLMPNGDLNAATGARFENAELNLRGSGFYPRRPLDVAVSPEGWVYLSITDGWILALRGL